MSFLYVMVLYLFIYSDNGYGVIMRLRSCFRILIFFNIFWIICLFIYMYRKNIICMYLYVFCVLKLYIN